MSVPVLVDTQRICRQCHTPLPPGETGTSCSHCQDTLGTRRVARETLPPPEVAEMARFFPALEILELCGQGGMGMIYKARQPQLDRLVALKILSPALSQEGAFAERFAHEAQALARLSHSNIVSIYDFGRAGGHFYLLMEFVEDATVNLYHLIQNRRLEAGEARRIGIEICQALQYAHEEGVVHRDIKASNIMLDKKRRVKITDFGLARLAGHDGLMEDAGYLMGTPNYMAPEQLENPEEADHRADVYSLGVVLYEMLTGRLPLGDYRPASELAGVDPRFNAIIARALEKNRYRRYQTVDEMRVDLEATASPPPTTVIAPAPARPFRWLSQLGFMAACGVAALTGRSR